MKLSQISAMAGSLIETVGEDTFCQQLASFGQQLSGFNSAVVVSFLNKEKPLILFDNLPPKYRDKSLKPYVEGAYLLDPLYEIYKKDLADGVYRLRDLTSREFEDSEYYNHYFEATGIVDEAGVLIKVSNDISIEISFGYRKTENLQNPLPDMQVLIDCFPLIQAACKQNWSRESQLVPLKRQLRTGGEFGVTLDAAFANFGKSVLSPRECEIVQLILKGYSSDAIAEMLTISRETVKVHRKRCYSKLQINTSAELFSLFLEAISLVPLGASDNDPLSYFYEEI
ncbi:MAG: helix-turn-helix transcriptional regulator [Alteromonadaceae bacterium]|nr:helix-turn-helix transcriptional regulator [Alteromonadaceae bacterium]